MACRRYWSRLTRGGWVCGMCRPIALTAVLQRQQLYEGNVYELRGVLHQLRSSQPYIAAAAAPLVNGVCQRMVTDARVAFRELEEHSHHSDVADGFVHMESLDGQTTLTYSGDVITINTTHFA